MMSFFFFNDTATTEIYTLSLHDALPICYHPPFAPRPHHRRGGDGALHDGPGRDGDRPGDRVQHPGGGLDPSCPGGDRKSTRLNSSHANISYAVFCLKKKKKVITDA